MSQDTFDDQPSLEDEMEKERYADALRDLFCIACKEYPELGRQIAVSHPITDPADRTTCLVDLSQLHKGLILRILIEGRREPMAQSYGAHFTETAEYAIIDGARLMGILGKLPYEERRALTNCTVAHITSKFPELEMDGKFEEIERLRGEMSAFVFHILHSL